MIVMNVTIRALRSQSFFLKMHFIIKNPVKKSNIKSKGSQQLKNILLINPLFAKNVSLLDLRKQSTEIILDELYPIVCIG